MFENLPHFAEQFQNFAPQAVEQLHGHFPNFTPQPPQPQNPLPSLSS